MNVGKDAPYHSLSGRGDCEAQWKGLHAPPKGCNAKDREHQVLVGRWTNQKSSYITGRMEDC